MGRCIRYGELSHICAEIELGCRGVNNTLFDCEIISIKSNCLAILYRVAISCYGDQSIGC